MERYFILVMVVTLGIVATQKTKGPEANSRDIQQKEKTITTCLRSAEYCDILTSYTKIKTSVGIVHEKRIYAATSCRSNARKNIKHWYTQLQYYPAPQAQRFCIVFADPADG